MFWYWNNKYSPAASSQMFVMATEFVMPDPLSSATVSWSTCSCCYSLIPTAIQISDRVVFMRFSYFVLEKWFLKKVHLSSHS